MKKFKFLSVCFVICALAAAFAIVPGAFAEDASADAPVVVTLNGAPAEAVSFSKDEKVTLNAETDLEGRIRWQYLADESENLWVSVYGENSTAFTLTYAKVFNMLNDKNTAQIRCAVGEVYSDSVTVTLIDESSAIGKALSASPFALTRAAEEEGTGTDEGTGEGTEDPGPFTFTIDYVDENGDPLAESFESPNIEKNTVVHLAVESPVIPNKVIYSLDGESTDTYLVSGAYQMLYPEVSVVMYKDGEPQTVVDPEKKCTLTVNYIKEDGTEVDGSFSVQFGVKELYNTKITCPEVAGYLPYVQLAESGDYVQTNEILPIYYCYTSQNIVLNVYYRETDVPYTVDYYKQNITDDNYVKADSRTYTGTTNSTVNAADIESVSYPGFTRLLYTDDVKIAADGSTALEVYFDRNYYLMLFDLDGGYGVEPIYARYETPISVGTPAKTGYRFLGWDNLATTTVENIQSSDLPDKMPLDGASYKAVWEPANSSYTVAYWLENPDTPGQYDYWYSETHSADTEDIIDGITHKEINSTHQADEEYKFAEYKEVSPAQISVNGDGSSVINVRYDRKEYTLKFYYAMSTGSGANIKYYVVGGTTYYFGASGKDSANSLTLIDQYYTDGGTYWDQCGQVDELPQLNGTGFSRVQDGKYVLGSDTGTEDFTYYYISLKAKYGADLSELWPCHVFNTVTRVGKNTTNPKNGWTKEEAVVSAWNGEHRVYYSQIHKNDNQTIKGNYSKLDSNLLWDKAQFNAYAEEVTETDAETGAETVTRTVDYLCFWDNGTDSVNWNAPGLFRYNIYIKALDGESTEGKTTRAYGGDTYYLRGTPLDTCDDADRGSTSNTNQQTPPSIQGFTYTNAYEYSEITGDDLSSEYKTGYNMYFYYTRNSYELVMQNVDTVVVNREVPYEADLSKGADYVPPYPFEELDAYEFAGWYTTENFIPGTEFSFTGATMPAYNIKLYAKWVPAIHKVEVYKDSTLTEQIGETISVPHGELVPEESRPGTPTNGNYDFVYWFYNDNGVEKAFDFESMPVRSDLKVYAKWSSNKLMPYVVRYKVKGTDEVIGDTEVFVAQTDEGSGLVGSTKTFEAKGGSDLYEGYREGYFPTVQSHSFTIGLTDEANTFTFEYIKKPAVPYKVRYRILDEAGNDIGPAFTTDASGNVIPAAENQSGEEYIKTVDDNQYAVVLEKYLPLKNYIPDNFQQKLVVTVNEDGTPNEEDNVITFYYTKDELHALWIQTHYTENLNGTYSEYLSLENTGDIGTVYTADEQNIDGFTFDDTVDGTLTSGKLTADGLELKLYYKRNEYPYEVRYLEYGSDKKLSETKKDKAKYEARITENAVDVFGYNLMTSSPQSRTIQIEEGETAVKNVITFYYTEKQATYTYSVVGPDGCGTVSNNSETVNVLSGNAVGSTATANPGYRFVGWYDNADCTGAPVSTVASYIPQKTNDDEGHTYYTGDHYYAKFIYDTADLKISKTGVNETLDPNTEFLFRVQGVSTDTHTSGIDITVTVTGNGMVIVKDLPVGKYTVTELTNWSWRYTPEEASKEVDVVSEASIIANTVTFTNSRNADNKWLDYNISEDNLFNGTAPSVPTLE